MLKDILDRLAPSRLQLVVVVFMTSVVARYGHVYVSWLDAIPAPWPWVASTAAIASGFFILLWFASWLATHVRQLWKRRADRQALDRIRELHFMTKRLTPSQIVLLQFARLNAKRLTLTDLKDVQTVLGLSFQSSTNELVSTNILTRDPAQFAWTLTELGEEQLHNLLPAFKEQGYLPHDFAFKASSGSIAR